MANGNGDDEGYAPSEVTRTVAGIVFLVIAGLAASRSSVPKDILNVLGLLVATFLFFKLTGIKSAEIEEVFKPGPIRSFASFIILLAIYTFSLKYLFSSWIEDVTRSTGSDPRYTRIICTLIAGAIFPYLWKMFAGIGLPGDETAIKLGSRGIAVIYSLFLLWQIVEAPDLNFAPEGAKDAKGVITTTPVAVKFICRNAKCPNFLGGKEKGEVRSAAINCAVCGSALQPITPEEAVNFVRPSPLEGVSKKLGDTWDGFVGGVKNLLPKPSERSSSSTSSGGARHRNSEPNGVRIRFASSQHQGFDDYRVVENGGGKLVVRQSDSQNVQTFSGKVVDGTWRGKWRSHKRAHSSGDQDPHGTFEIDLETKRGVCHDELEGERMDLSIEFL